MTEPVFWDRTRAQTDDTCERSRYWLTEYRGRGVVPAARPVYFDFGSLIAAAHHSVRSGAADAGAAARKAEGLAYEAGLRAAPAALTPAERAVRASELACLAGALIEGFYMPGGPWDLLMQDYRVVHSEVELTLDHAPGVRFGCRPDLVLQRLADGAYGYPDDKTTGNLDKDWWDQWETDVQLQSGARAIREKLGYDITFVMVIAHYKGYRYKDEYRSPLVYGYRNQGMSGLPLYTGKRPHEWRGWDRFAVWEEMGYAAWVRQMPLQELMANFAFTRPIAIREDLVNAWLAQRAMREKEIARASDLLLLLEKQIDRGVVTGEARDHILDEAFRQNFKACTPFRRAPCPYREACFLPHVNADPLKSNLYTWREPHHDTDPLYAVSPPDRD